MGAFRAVLILTLAALLGACVPTREIRTDLTRGASPPQPADIAAAPTFVPTACDVGSAAASENRRVIEDYDSYTLAFAEFDDQGWSYDTDQQLKLIRERLAKELADPAHTDLDFVVVVFVHGWHHNAHDNDCNVQEARQMLRIASEQFDAAVRKGAGFARHRRVFGIYVGWRGEAVNAALLRYTTIIDRRDAAEKVAKGSVRQLLADLQQQQLSARAAAAADPTRQRYGKPDQGQIAARMYTIVVGHSFGGLIVFNALSQQLIADLTAVADTSCSHGDVTGVTRTWPDSVVLINPAFEATRFEPVNRIADRAAACGYKAQYPLLTVITADNDRWTGAVFTAGRSVLTLFEAYDNTSRQSRAAERDVNLRAIGFVDRYRTHRLCLLPPTGDSHATISSTLTPTSTADPLTVSSRTVWVVGAPPDIVDGHDGFLYARQRGSVPKPYLLEWLVATHADPKNAVAAPNVCGSWH